MTYQIMDEDGEIYTFNNVEEVLEALAGALTGHKYKWGTEWFPGRL